MNYHSNNTNVYDARNNSVTYYSDSPPAHEKVYESTNLLGVSTSPARKRSVVTSSFPGQNNNTTGHHQQRLSVAVSAQELAKDTKKTDEFHRDMLAWYRTEATMLRVAM